MLVFIFWTTSYKFLLLFLKRGGVSDWSHLIVFWCRCLFCQCVFLLLWHLKDMSIAAKLAENKKRSTEYLVCFLPCSKTPLWKREKKRNSLQIVFHAFLCCGCCGVVFVWLVGCLFLTNSSVESVSCSCASAGGASRAASSCLVVSRVSVRVALRAG